MTPEQVGDPLFERFREVIYGRFLAGDSIASIIEDYTNLAAKYHHEVPPEVAEAIIRFEANRDNEKAQIERC